ncbi:hypothetical protein [Solirubrobacter soli]|uniref:hypothetical protein n=1 Tax=Solirubrobacter soli TaxID=363832 RepID=UPI00042426F6|nr:hypothetical protein [Solirubrobacter soli]
MEATGERALAPGIVAAGITAGVSAAVVLVAGALLALITPDNSILGAVGIDASFVTEAFRQAVGTQLTAMVEEPGLLVSGTRRIHPLLLLAIPLGTLIVMTRRQLYRTEGATTMARFGWAALAAVPFGLLMLAFALIGGDSDTTRISTSAGGALALGLLWGALGGLIGAATVLGLEDVLERVPPGARTALDAALAALRPLAAVLIVCTALGLAGWMVQVARDAGGVRAGRPALTAAVEEAAYVGEHGIHLNALAAGARFTTDATGPLGLPFPVADANAVPSGDGGLRIFSYDRAIPTGVLVPAIVLLMGMVALAALYGGVSAARAVGATTRRRGALWGALTGPAWALAMAVLVVGAGGLLHGDADDASVFVIFLLGGALLGAAGGAIAGRGQPEGAASSSS